MGACYDVTMTAKWKYNTESIAAEKLREHIENDERTNYNLETFSKEGTTIDTLNGMIRICLAGWKKSPYTVTEENGQFIYDNSFDASFGWDSVMCEMFEVLTPFLDDGSEIVIYPDNEHIHLIIKNGKCIKIS